MEARPCKPETSQQLEIKKYRELLAERDAELAAAKHQSIQDLQARTEDREAISQLKDDLLRQNRALDLVRLELESFNYSISHDLRAPLRHLVGFSGALMEDYGDTLDGTARGFLDCIAKAGHKMEVQIEALLKLSRLNRQEMSLGSVDLSHLVRECAATLQDLAPERQAVFTIADSLSVRADASLLRAAIVHLLDNAWKFTSKRDAATIEFGQKQEGDTVTFYLRDNGAGFDMRYADRLFGAFQRMHQEGEFDGTGIGLATVQRIIHRHGGRIWADATVGVGATFFFTLSD